VLFQLPKTTVALVDDIKERQGVRSCSQALLQLIELGREVIGREMPPPEHGHQLPPARYLPGVPCRAGAIFAMVPFDACDSSVGYRTPAQARIDMTMANAA
jgi:hypothetical protein